VSSGPNPSVFGQGVTFTAVVSANAPGSGTPTGSVQFQVDGANYGSPVQLTSGQASISDSALGLGNHLIAATYTGDTNFTGSGAPASAQTVNQGATSTQVGSGPNPSVFGQAVTFTAIVSASAPGSGTPT